MAEKRNFDSDFCGSLPLHHINSIQDYGYLLVLDMKDLSVLQASENNAAILGKSIQEIIGTPLSDYIKEEDLEKVRQVLKKGVTHKIPLTFTLHASFNPVDYHALLHIKTDYLIIELEKVSDLGNRKFSDVFQEVKYISAAIEQANTVQEVCDAAVHELRRLSGFDGILMYRFDSDWNGTVIAEEKDDRLEHYLGQTFPASDVPKQARALYLTNPYRLIPNREYQPVRLYPVINPVTNAFTDLSACNLRGVAAVHLEYMKNMNINASMSIRVIHNEMLWGLISCHHIDHKYLNYEVCSIFEWLSDVISNRITLILNKEEYSLSGDLQQKRMALTDLVYAEENVVDGLLKDDQADVLDLFQATGAVISLNGRIEIKGLAPEKDDLENLMLWLEGKNFSKVFSTDHLVGLYEDAIAYADRVSGLLFIPIDSDKGDFLVCFRPELVEDIKWGGDPNQAINFEKDGKNYHPRNSFKLWIQTVLKHSLSWKKQELEVAESLRSFLFEFRTKQLLN
ncbi:GAF domain-containing protein [Pedobacter sp. AW31-3R]|uniref:GAF domain-containing protein n=1 Tax=Pedobacter sp. AW31-3R TaxID=3445781 RepID=UPI003F9EFE95